MADLLEKLWPAFVSEVTEQLDSVELSLARRDAVRTLDVNHLFRNFHTIKGSCSMIGFVSMEAIAHRSEDILAAVRNQDIALDDAVIDILLDAVSCLKKQFQSSSQNRLNPAQDTGLLERLSHFVDERVQPVSQSDTASSASLDQLVQTAKMAVPVMVLGLDPAARFEQVEKAVMAMADAALQNGLRVLAGALRNYLELLRGQSEPQVLLEQLADIFEKAGLIAAERQVDLYLDMGARLCRSKLATAYLDNLSTLDQLLQDLKSSASEQWQVEQFLGIVAACNLLSHYSTLFRLLQLQQSWRYVRQLVVEVSRGYLVFNQAIIEQILHISELAHSKQALAGGDETFESECKAVREQLQATTARHNNERDEIVSLKEQIIGRTTLCMDSLIDLKMDVLEKIAAAIEGGKLAVEIDIDFTDEIVSEKVLTAVRALGELAHSRTMFHDIVNGVAQRTSFSFLILSRKTLEDIHKILSIIDKEQKTFTILGTESAAPETEKTLPEQQEVSSDVSEKLTDAVGDDAAALVSDTALSLSSLKVEGAAIDRVINDIGELVTHHNRLSHLVMQDEFSWHVHLLKTLLAAKGEQGRLTVTFFENLLQQLIASNESLQGSLSRIQSSVLDLRVVPIAYVFNRFHSFVRTTAQKLDKKVALDVVGEQVRIDKGMIDVLSEPLAHMVRNSIDHGIETPEQRRQLGKDETGTIQLKAVQNSETVIVEIRDDGAGLDKQRILERCIEKGLLNAGGQYSDQEIFKYIFEPGFSTSRTLTETSGRGVGMDVVKSRIVEVGGTVSVSSEQGKGTVIRLKLPVSAAIQSVVLVESQQQTLAIPERHIVEVMNVQAGDIQLIQEQSAIILRDMIVPVYCLQELLQTSETPLYRTQAQQYEVVILANDQSLIGLVVDSALGRAEILVRDVHESLRRMPGISGASILGDGRVIIILDCVGLFELAMTAGQNIIGMTTAV